MTILTGEDQYRVFDFMPGFVCILSGSEHRYRYVNQAYRDISGPREFVNRTVQEVFPELAGQGFYELLDKVFITGEPFAARDILVQLSRDDGDRFIDLLYNPIRDVNGVITGIFVGGYDATDAHRARERWRALAELSEKLRVFASADDLPHEAAAILGRTLGVSRVGYGTIDDETATLHVERDWTASRIQSLAGITPLLEYGSFIDSLRRDEFVSIPDVRLDPRTSGAADALESRSARAFVNVPVVERGKLVAVLYLNNDEVRHWRDDELDLVKEVAARVRTTVQRHADEVARRGIEDRYRVLFDAIDVGFCVVEMKFDETDRAIDYRLAEINPAFERQTGLYGASGKWVSEAAPGLERYWYDLYGAVALTGTPARFENFAEPFGRWYDVHAFRAGAPEERRVAILFNDITDRKNAEDSLRELNATLEVRVAERTLERDMAWKVSRDLLLTVGYDGLYKSVNPAWTNVLGWTTDELLGASFADFIHEDDKERGTTGFAQFLAGKEIGDVDLRMMTSSGAVRWISWSVSPSSDVIYVSGRDITDRKELEEQLRQSQKMEAVGQLTGGLAHDFNNILAGISGSLELMGTRLRQGRLTDLDRYISGASAAAKRAASLTQRLLAFSRRQTLAPKATDAHALVNGLLELIHRTVGPQISVENVGAAGLWPTFVDDAQLENAILNLCINARDAMPEGGKITIETANRWMDERSSRDRGIAPGQYVSICVSDTGTGMPPEVVERAFDPFFTTKPIGAGTGLGLSMVHGFAGQSNGAARIYSEFEKGTMVCIYLPRHLGAAEVTPASEAAGDSPRSDSGETVLIVDDEPLVRMIAVEALEELGYSVLEAGDARAALNLLTTRREITLLISDVGLPGGMNGRQLADAARETRPELQVLFITGYAENAVLNHGHLDQGMHVMTKPFQMDAFARRVKQLVDAATERRQH